MNDQSYSTYADEQGYAESIIRSSTGLQNTTHNLQMIKYQGRTFPYLCMSINIRLLTHTHFLRQQGGNHITFFSCSFLMVSQRISSSYQTIYNFRLCLHTKLYFYTFTNYSLLVLDNNILVSRLLCAGKHDNMILGLKVFRYE